MGVFRRAPGREARHPVPMKRPLISLIPGLAAAFALGLLVSAFAYDGDHAALAAAPGPALSTVTVGFSPGNAQAVVVDTIDAARTSIRLAAYSFTSKPIAAALVAASKRGVDVKVVVDKSQRTERYTSATFLANMGIPVRVDARYSIMHNKFMVIDGTTVQTGSFNYTASAARRNAENVIVVAGAPGMVSAYDTEWRGLWNESEPYGARY